MREILQATFDVAHELIDSEQASVAKPPASPNDVRAQIDLALPREGVGQQAALEKVARVVGLTPKTSGHRFFNQLFAGREALATSAEMIAGLLNVSMYTYKVAGVHALIENQVIGRMCELAGFTDGDGIFAPGGSLGNLTALAMAAFEARPDLHDQGLSGPRLRVYLSEEGHYSVRKGAGLLGLGRANVLDIPVDQHGHMRVDALVSRIQQDREDGHEPLCVVATAGTTVRGAFDPIAEIGEVARRERLWLHVDGAFGGSFLLHPELRNKLEGVQRADSLTWNPHKMMGVPLPCAAVLVRRKGLLRRHFNEAADYLFQQDSEDLNLGTKSIQCGRRNDALKLWAAWQHLGDDGWRMRIDRQMTLLSYAKSLVQEDPALELVGEPESLNLCFLVKGKPSDVLCEALAKRGLEQVGFGVVEGRKVIRLVTVNPEIKKSEIDLLFADLRSVAETV